MKRKFDVLLDGIIPAFVFICTMFFGSLLLKEDFSRVIQWWLTLLVMGVAAYPVAGLIFSKFHDGGFVFSKSIGVALSGILLWYLSSLRVMRFTRLNSILCVAILFVIGVILVLISTIQKKRGRDRGYLCYELDPSRICSAIRGEILFLAFFIIWCYFRGFKPEAYGTEKFMDYGFMAVIDRSEFMPPEDLWMAGKSINYYYVGQYIATFLSKVSGISVAYGYNLMLMTLAAFGFTMPYSIAHNVMSTFLKDKDRRIRTWIIPSEDKTEKTKKHGILPVVTGAIAGAAVSMAGNMHYFIFRFLVPLAQKLIGIEEESSFWFPNSTRYIGYNPETSDKTIHEFPSYSFILGDLHAHVINIMFVLTVIAMLFAWLLYRKENMDKLRSGSSVPRASILREAAHPMILLLGFFIGLFHMTNFWDFPIYFVVAGAVILFSNAVIYQFSLNTIKLTALQALYVLVISKVVSLPFSLSFEQISTAIRLCVYRTPLHQLAVLWGIPVILIVMFFADRYIKLSHSGVLNGYTYVNGERRIETAPENTSTDSVPFVKEKNKLFQFIENLSVTELFILTIGLCAMGLVLIPELVYVKDIYTGDYKRANTMFKLTYQAYIMFGICIAYLLVRYICFCKEVGKRTIAIVVAICFATTLGYFGNATRAWFGKITDRSRYEGLDATAFVSDESEQDAQAVAWLNENVAGTPVILEIHGDSYTYAERMSVLTGLPTVLGWRTHEWLWRSNAGVGYPPVMSEREADICAIYTSDDEEEVKQLIAKYNIEYIIIGECERNSDKLSEPVNEELLFRLGRVVFESSMGENGEPTYIIQMNQK